MAPLLLSGYPLFPVTEDEDVAVIDGEDGRVQFGPAGWVLAGLGCPAFSGPANWCYFMPLPADSGTRPGLLAESGNRALSEDVSDYTGVRCTAL